MYVSGEKKNVLYVLKELTRLEEYRSHWLRYSYGIQNFVSKEDSRLGIPGKTTFKV